MNSASIIPVYVLGMLALEFASRVNARIVPTRAIQDVLDVIDHAASDAAASTISTTSSLKLSATNSSGSKSLVLALVISFVGLVVCILIGCLCRQRCRRFASRRNVMLTSIQRQRADSQEMGGYTQLADASKNFRSADASHHSQSDNDKVVSSADGQLQPKSNPQPAQPLGVPIKPSLSMNDFDPIHVLGEGSFGKVLLVRSKATGRQFAMKILKKARVKGEGQVERTRAERNVLERLDCPYIVKLHGSFQSEDKLYFVLDYHPGGDLYYLLSRTGCFPEEQLRYYAANILVALDHLHSNQVIYRDLKPENILLAEDGRAVLTDFGLCKDVTFNAANLQTSESRTKLLESANASTENKSITPSPGYQAWAESFVGTPEYLAPEIIRGEPYGPSCDFYALGVTLFELATGQPPFYHTDAMKIYRFTLHGQVSIPSDFSLPLQDLLRGLLQRDLSHRLGSRGGAKEIMRHEFFASVDWNAVREHRVPAPFRPVINDTTTNVDARFAEMPMFSVPEHSLLGQGNPLANAAAVNAGRGTHLADIDEDEVGDGNKLSRTFEGFSYRGDSLSEMIKADQDMF